MSASSTSSSSAPTTRWIFVHDGPIVEHLRQQCATNDVAVVGPLWICDCISHLDVLPCPARSVATGSSFDVKRQTAGAAASSSAASSAAPAPAADSRDGSDDAPPAKRRKGVHWARYLPASVRTHVMLLCVLVRRVSDRPGHRRKLWLAVRQCWFLSQAPRWTQTQTRIRTRRHQRLRPKLVPQLLLLLRLLLRARAQPHPLPHCCTRMRDSLLKVSGSLPSRRPHSLQHRSGQLSANADATLSQWALSFRLHSLQGRRLLLRWCLRPLRFLGGTHRSWQCTTLYKVPKFASSAIIVRSVVGLGQAVSFMQAVGSAANAARLLPGLLQQAHRLREALPPTARQFCPRCNGSHVQEPPAALAAWILRRNIVRDRNAQVGAGQLFQMYRGDDGALNQTRFGLALSSWACRQLNSGRKTFYYELSVAAPALLAPPGPADSV